MAMYLTFKEEYQIFCYHDFSLQSHKVANVLLQMQQGEKKFQLVNNVSYLSDERDDSLCAIFVHIWQIDLITEQHQPLAQLDRSEDYTVGGTSVLAVMIKGFQQQLWGGGTGEVQTHNLAESRKKHIF